MPVGSQVLIESRSTIGLIARLRLLLLFFGEQIEDFLPLGPVGDGFEQALVMFDVLATHKSINVHEALRASARRHRKVASAVSVVE
jgi:hypothetical protein